MAMTEHSGSTVSSVRAAPGPDAVL